MPNGAWMHIQRYKGSFFNRKLPAFLTAGYTSAILRDHNTDKEDIIMEKKLNEYLAHLKREERSRSTCRQYERDVQNFLKFIRGEALSKELVIRYKESLQETYRPASVNAKLAAVNGFLSFIGKDSMKVRQLKIQRQAFCPGERELTKAEYLRLIRTARSRRNGKLALLIQTICGTGIRVSELSFITAEAIAVGEVDIRLKGKNRTILIAGKLRQALKSYIKRNGISSGPVFVTRSGKPMDRSNIWRMMKDLCAEAGVEGSKVFPHSLRKLFARCFYHVDKDIAKLADILGHSNINTTRIYIISSGREHRQRMDALGLIV